MTIVKCHSLPWEFWPSGTQSIHNAMGEGSPHSLSTCCVPVPGAAFPLDGTGQSSQDLCLTCPHSLGVSHAGTCPLSPASLARPHAHSQGLVGPDAGAAGPLGLAASQTPMWGGQQELRCQETVSLDSL